MHAIRYKTDVYLSQVLLNHRNFKTALILTLLISITTYAQKSEEIDTRKGRFEIGYTLLDAFALYSGNIPDEAFHTNKFFSKDFPYIHPDEPDNLIFIRYVFNKKPGNKFSYSAGIEYLHTKPNRFDEGAGVLDGLYLANGYTQVGLGFGLYYDLSKKIIFNTILSTGPMLSNPNWDNKEYIPYKKLTPFLSSNYQITGWGLTNTTAIDVLLGERFALIATFALHYDKSRELRATDGSKGSFHSLIHSFGFGGKIRF
jgi:hypothetical protein